MGHAKDMADRLPPLYRDGTLIRGTEDGSVGGILDSPAIQLEIFDEDAREVQRAHWFDSALELEEVANLAAILPRAAI